MTNQEYAESGGAVCPCCGSDELEWGDLDAGDNGTVTQRVCCLECEADWLDRFVLAGYTVLDSGNQALPELVA